MKTFADEPTAASASSRLRDMPDVAQSGSIAPEAPIDDETVPRRPAEEILAHPLFQEVRKRHIVNTLETCAIRNFPGSFAIDAWRVILLGQIIGMAGDDVEGGATATPTELKRRMATYGLYSARQIDAYLSRLIQTGYLEVAVHHKDRRVRLLRPLQPLVDWYWSFLEVYHLSYQTLFPDPGFELISRRQEAFLPFMARVGADRIAMANSMDLLGRDPDLAVFFSRGSGTMVLYVALFLSLEDPDRELREMDFVAYAEDFGRSRSHIRNLIELAVEKGFLRETGRRPQTLQVTPRLRETMDRYIADTIRTSERTYRRAERIYLQSIAGLGQTSPEATSA